MSAPDSTVVNSQTPIPISAARGNRVVEPKGAGRARLRLRAWEARRRRAGRAVIAASFPIAYLLSMGAEAPELAVQIGLWLWVGAVSVAGVCAEAVWRYRYRLERGLFGTEASTIGPVA